MRDDHEDVLLDVGDFDAVAEYLDVVLLLAGQVQRVEVVGAPRAAVRPYRLQRRVAHVERVRPAHVQGVPSQARLAREPSREPTLAWR